MEYETEIRTNSSFKLFKIKYCFDDPVSPYLVNLVNSFCLYRISISDEIDEVFDLANTRWQLDDWILRRYSPDRIPGNKEITNENVHMIILPIGKIDVIDGKFTNIDGKYSIVVRGNNRFSLDCFCGSTHTITCDSIGEIKTLIENYKMIPINNGVIYKEHFNVYYSYIHNDYGLYLTFRFNCHGEQFDLQVYDLTVKEAHLMAEKIALVSELMDKVSIYSKCAIYMSSLCRQNQSEQCQLHRGYHETVITNGNIKTMLCRLVIIIEDKYMVSSNYKDALFGYVKGYDISELDCVSLVSRNKNANKLI